MNDSIKRLIKNYVGARKSWEAWCFLTNFNLKNQKFETRYYILKNEFLSYMNFLTLKDFHIEFHKITRRNSNNKDNIFKLLENLQNLDPNKKILAQNCINELETHNKTITDLCNLRDKYFAHLDKDHLDYLYNGPNVHEILACFIAIENGIIALTSIEEFNLVLKTIPSRDDFEL